MMIISGSSISFMIDEVLSNKTPLYGRATNIIKLKEFDFKDSALFFPKYTNIEKAIAYGILGGVPAYLEQFSPDKNLTDNIRDKIIKESSMLKEEADSFLRQEFREPAIYNSILNAIASGSSKLNEIATKIKEDSTKCNKYMDALRKINIIQKRIPCGDKDVSKKTIYRITDNYFKFWYHFISNKRNYFDIVGDEESAKYIMKDTNINNYMGNIYEDMCIQYLIEKAKINDLEFIPTKYGHWWGTDKKNKKLVDIDIMLIDESNKNVVIGECKFKNENYDKKDLDEFLEKLNAFPNVNIYPYIFIKSNFTDSVIKIAKERKIKLLTIDDLYK